MCDRWLNDFPAFLEDMGPKPSPSHSIERIDNSLGYSPENCVWATRKEQNTNKRNNRMITFNGTTQCLADLARTYGMRPHTLLARLDRFKWDLHKALTTPVEPGGMGARPRPS